ncbi:hypothetical protein AOLI_G00238150 [Acnodon oligacanthus]
MNRTRDLAKFLSNTRVRLQEEAAAAAGLKMGRSATYIWTLFLLLQALVDLAQCCPRPCACPHPREVHCTFRSLLTVPAGVPKQVERMNLGFNSINRITDSSFAGMRKLELLMMHGNDVHNIPNGTFQDLISLQMMKMSYNKLRVISRQTFQGLWNLARLHLDHNRLEFIHPDAFQGLTSLRLLQLEGNRLQQLHPATFATLSVLGYFPVSTLKNLYLSENGLTTLPQKMLAGMPHLENLFLHDNPWICDCRMKWFKDWSKNAAGVLKCKKDRAFAGGQLCPVCSSPKHLKKKDLQELDNPTCSSPIISTPHRTSASDTESELMTLQEFRQPLGNISLELSDEHGNKVDLHCQVNEPTESTRINWDHVNPYQITANVSLRLDLECPIDRANYERLWRLIAYYSDVPAHLQREIMLSKESHFSYRYRQDAERDALYYTGVKVNIEAEPAWVMQPSLDLQLNRPQSTSKRVRLVLSTHITQLVEAEAVRQQRRRWIIIESRNNTRTSQAAVVGSPIQMHCNVHSSGNPLIKWMLPNGSKVEAPYQSSDKRITVTPSGLLDIKAVDHSDSGVYYCIALVMDDISILPFRLTVEESSSPPPGGEGVAEPVTRAAGGPVSIPCLASGSPDPDINWILPDSSIINTMSNLSKMFLASNGTLTIRHSHLSDNGYYKCVAGNQHGADSLATKLTLTRPAGGLHIRKYSSSPQPAEGVSTKIKAPVDNDVEASGDNENGKPEEKATPGQVDTPIRRKIPNVSVRGGHPSRKSWRRPTMPRRRIMPPGAERSNTVERRKINVSNSQIDPKRWANILAKVRGGGSSPKTTTPISVQTSTNILQELDTASIKKSGSFDRPEGSSPDGTTIPPPQEIYRVTESGMPAQTTDISLDIRPLGSAEQTHITYQITAPESNPDSDLFTSSTYVMPTTLGPQPTRYSVTRPDIAKWAELSTVWSTTSYGSLFQENQSHTTVSSKVTETIQRSEGDDDVNVDDDDEFSISKSFGNGVKVYQGEADHNPILTTAVAFEEQSTEKYADARSFTEPTTTAAQQARQNLERHTTQEKHGISQIPSLTTTPPTNEPISENNRGKHTISANPAPSSRARNSSSLRRKNGGRRRRPNRNKTRSKSSKSSAYVTNVTPQPTTLASVSEVTKTTASSQSEIETSAVVMSTGAKVDTTVPFTDSQATSLSKMTHEKNTDPLYNGRNNLSPDSSLQEKVSEAKKTPSSYPKPPKISMSTTMTAVPPSISLGFTGHRETEINIETISTISPPVHNALFTTAYIEGFTSIHPPAVKLSEAQKESATGHTADTFPESLPLQPAAIPGVGSDKAQDQFTPSEAENVPPSSELVRDFPLSPFSSSAPSIHHEITKSHDSEIPSGSTKANLYESPQVTTEGPAISQRPRGSELTAIIQLSSASTDGGHAKEGASIAQNTRIQRFEVHPNGTLIIRNVLPLDRGQYLCSVQNQYGEDKMTVTLVVLADPPRMLQPRYRDTTAYLGDTVELECRSHGHPPPRTTWVLPDRAMVHMDAPSPGTPERRVTVSANGTLRIVSATYTDRGVYKCIASSAAGADTISVHLMVAALPPVVHQLRHENVSLPEGITAYMNCSARGAPFPTISWTTPDGLQLRPSQFVSGRNLFVFPNGTLYIRGVSQADAGKYECTATNAVGSLSRTVRLTVKNTIASARARITSSSPQKTDVAYGGRLQLDCVASGDPEPRVIWRTPSKKLVDAHYSYDSRIKVFTNGSLTMHSITEKDEGDYLCVARNKIGDDYVPLKVNVLTKPAKIEQRNQANQKVMYGHDLQVDCVASGLPNPKIQWALPDGTMINSIVKTDSSGGGRRRRYVVFDNGTLFFNEVGMHEEGDYTCYAENQIGKDEMKVHVKVVADVPVIRNKTYEVIRVMYGESVSLKCRAKGEPNPMILWFSPTNRAIPSTSDKYVIHSDGTLVIQNVQRFDGGNYTCLARNSAGQDRKVSRLEILVSPPAINGLRGSTNSLRVSAVREQRTLIHCEATGIPVPRVMWVLPENVILPSPYYGSRMTVHRNGTLDIRSLRVTDAAQLTCIARNEGGEARLVVQLDVTDIAEKPRLKSPKTESLTLTVGRSMTINCSFEGYPAPQITWILPSGAPITTGSQFNKFLHKSDGTLVISNPALSEAGTYRCLGRSGGGFLERTVVLMAGRKPEINNKYNSPISVVNGESLQLHCLSTSDPVRLTWTLPSGVVLNRPQRAGRYAVLPNGTLSIHQASVYDRGSYTCRAANEYGSSLLTIPVIIIAYPPRITSGLAPSTYARRGVAIQLNCAAVGIPKAEVAWETPDRTRLVISPQPRMFGNKYLHPHGSLIIQNPMPKDAGFYRCTARNVIGVDSKAFIKWQANINAVPIK